MAEQEVDRSMCRAMGPGWAARGLGSRVVSPPRTRPVRRLMSPPPLRQLHEDLLAERARGMRIDALWRALGEEPARHTRPLHRDPISAASSQSGGQGPGAAAGPGGEGVVSAASSQSGGQGPAAAAGPGGRASGCSPCGSSLAQRSAPSEDGDLVMYSCPGTPTAAAPPRPPLNGPAAAAAASPPPEGGAAAGSRSPRRGGGLAPPQPGLAGARRQSYVPAIVSGADAAPARQRRRQSAPGAVGLGPAPAAVGGGRAPLPSPRGGPADRADATPLSSPVSLSGSGARSSQRQPGAQGGGGPSAGQAAGAGVLQRSGSAGAARGAPSAGASDAASFQSASSWAQPQRASPPPRKSQRGPGGGDQRAAQRPPTPTGRPPTPPLRRPETPPQRPPTPPQHRRPETPPQHRRPETPPQARRPETPRGEQPALAGGRDSQSRASSARRSAGGPAPCRPAPAPEDPPSVRPAIEPARASAPAPAAPALPSGADSSAAAPAAPARVEAPAAAPATKVPAGAPAHPAPAAAPAAPPTPRGTPSPPAAAGGAAAAPASPPADPLRQHGGAAATAARAALWPSAQSRTPTERRGSPSMRTAEDAGSAPGQPSAVVQLRAARDAAPDPVSGRSSAASLLDLGEDAPPADLSGRGFGVRSRQPGGLSSPAAAGCSSRGRPPQMSVPLRRPRGYPAVPRVCSGANWRLISPHPSTLTHLSDARSPEAVSSPAARPAARPAPSSPSPERAAAGAVAEFAAAVWAEHAPAGRPLPSAAIGTIATAVLGEVAAGADAPALRAYRDERAAGSRAAAESLRRLLHSQGMRGGEETLFRADLTAALSGPLAASDPTRLLVTGARDSGKSTMLAAAVTECIAPSLAAQGELERSLLVPVPFAEVLRDGGSPQDAVQLHERLSAVFVDCLCAQHAALHPARAALAQWWQRLAVSTEVEELPAQFTASCPGAAALWRRHGAAMLSSSFGDPARALSCLLALPELFRDSLGFLRTVWVLDDLDRADAVVRGARGLQAPLLPAVLAAACGPHSHCIASAAEGAALPLAAVLRCAQAPVSTRGVVSRARLLAQHPALPHLIRCCGVEYPITVFGGCPGYLAPFVRLLEAQQPPGAEGAGGGGQGTRCVEFFSESLSDLFQRLALLHPPEQP
eukprot:TRINITY_DN3389_c0_g1_i2.p1 TRINITY_DN3389_c0_g1~~TRINITY_DN3389_c0_g1_i2.p1  ORF type:complete len:1146 (+),score=204.88 TRINITY_DN3389_c0_g1_i2:99-3536(+)